MKTFPKIGAFIVVIVFVLGVGFLIFKHPGSPISTNSDTGSSDTTPALPDQGTTPTPLTAPLAEFDKRVSVYLGEKITFTNGLTLTLDQVNDSRCQPDVECFWQGEISATLFLGSVGSTHLSEFHLGTVTSKSVSLKGYTFTLSNAAKRSISIVVSKVVRAPVGNVSGHVTIGPFCPSETVDSPCKVPPEAYSSRRVVVYGSDGVTINRNDIVINAKGNYTVTLDVGKYFLQVSPAGIGPGEKKPVTVTENQTVVVDFNIDTGIR